MEPLTLQLEQDFSSSGFSRHPTWLTELMKSAFVSFEDKGYPSPREEAWRYTNVVPMTETPFRFVKDSKFSGVSKDKIKHFVADIEGALCLVFVNGFFQPQLSTLQGLPQGMILQSMAEALKTHSHLVRPYLARFADYREHPFVAVNTAFIHDGLFIFVPKKTVVKFPVHLVYFSASEGQETVTHPRNLFVVEEQGQLQLIESYAGEGTYWTNTVTEIVAGSRATVDHVRVQKEDLKATHFSSVFSHQAADSHFHSHLFSFGGHLVRNNTHVILGGEKSDCLLNGFFMGQGQQHVDNQTTMDHASPYASSDEFYKGILKDQAQGVFNGRIIVRPQAQKTNARQSNRNLLLSEEARMNTKPNLEIYANDVRCSHGATVGHIDEEQLFYLRSRGLDRHISYDLLTYAFAREIIQKVPLEGISRSLECDLFQYLHGETSQKVPSAALPFSRGPQRTV